MNGVHPYYGANGVADYIDRWIFDEEEDLILLAEDGGHFDEFSTRPIAYRVSGKMLGEQPCPRTQSKEV